MKTIEEKAKAYDEALKVAKDIRNGEATYIPNGTPVIDAIFPELKEGKDERIRRVIRGWIYTRPASFFDNGISKEEILAWLEKQGDQELLVTNVEKNIHPIIVKKTGLGRCAVEHEDKVEPKFKKGEWLVENHPNNYARFLQILEIYNFNGKHNYVVSRDLHNDEDVAGCEFIETHWHPFYVKDAKDGDVLCSEQIILLFKKWEYNNDWNFVIAYAGIDITGKLQITNEHWLISNHAHPATKEGRDLLFAKMKEAGYEWDADKKKLKKIEQKPAWSEEDEKIYQSIMDDTVQENQLDGKQIDWLRNIRYRNFAQPKYTWKPSREQMDAVKSAALDVAKFSSRSEQLRLENEPYYKALMSLYNDLEKLREE